MDLSLIVAVNAENWAIGYQGELLYHIKEDMKRFKELTYSPDRKNVVIMGRATFDSLPNGCPLKGRHNIVLSRRVWSTTTDNLTFVKSIEEALYVANTICRGLEKVFVIGGGQVYNQFLDYCSVAYVTKVFAKPTLADSFMPNLDISKKWSIYDNGEMLTSYNGFKYKFTVYKNLATVKIT